MGSGPTFSMQCTFSGGRWKQDPGRNALVQVANATARRIAKPGQVFNRVHVADIAQATWTSLTRRSNGIFNITDDEPTPPGEGSCCSPS